MFFYFGVFGFFCFCDYIVELLTRKVKLQNIIMHDSFTNSASIKEILRKAEDFLYPCIAYLTQMVSISTSAPRGRAPTSTALRAGYCPSVKNSA